MSERPFPENDQPAPRRPWLSESDSDSLPLSLTRRSPFPRPPHHPEGLRLPAGVELGFVPRSARGHDVVFPVRRVAGGAGERQEEDGSRRFAGLLLSSV